jgi:hypothetical protein
MDLEWGYETINSGRILRPSDQNHSKTAAHPPYENCRQYSREPDAGSHSTGLHHPARIQSTMMVNLLCLPALSLGNSKALT